MVRASLMTAAALVLIAAALQLATAAAPAAPIGLPGCKTMCGNVSVPYPFGIQPGCHLPGFNLTCNTSGHGSPRLLLGDGSFQVVNIFLNNATLRVLFDNYNLIKQTDVVTSDGMNITLASIFAGLPYRVAIFSNELVVFGCQVLAMLVADEMRLTDGQSLIAAGCTSFCNPFTAFVNDSHYCTNMGCCQASCPTSDWDHMPTKLHVRSLEKWNKTLETRSPHDVTVFFSEKGWLDNNYLQTTDRYALILRWDITQGLSLSESVKNLDPPDYNCPAPIAKLCKSNNSKCTWDTEVYECQCKEGYDGNPYLKNGCQDIDECTRCFGDCTNTDGSFECRCPSGTFGDATIRDGCVKAAGFSTDTLQLAGMDQAPIGRPQCDTACGQIQVPYPFGFGSSQCYLPGFNLTCDKGHNPPRLLVGSGKNTFEVVGISLNTSTMRVLHTTSFDITTTTDKQVLDSRFMPFRDDDKQVGIHFPDIGVPYMLSEQNELILMGCNVEVALHDYADDIISTCTSNCTSRRIGYGYTKHDDNEFCSGNDGCCHAPIPPGSRPKKVKFRLLSQPYNEVPPLAFVAEAGQINQWYSIFNRSTTQYHIRNESGISDAPIVSQYMASKVPIILRWMLKENITTSTQSICSRENGSYVCRCKKGFYGNPYIGCQDIDECKIPSLHSPCYGDCKNLPGKFECRCPRGTRGDPNKQGGCIPYLGAATIGILAASGPTLLLLVFGVIFSLRKLKEHRKRLLRLKYFKQNRGQLLQQLVSHGSDIAERMIITIEELAKATNNFDKARELGGGGHGTVYKGILSDQHVVAIKKSKITVQKEINEFINEVAILSQVNHRNVVKLFGCCLETEVPLLVYEFISNGTLYQHLHVEGPVSLSWSIRLRIAKETASALAYLHSSVSVPIIHKDIKSSNILLDDAFTAKVSDFGASRYIPVEKIGLTTAVQGTIGYLDPLCFYTGRLNEKSDVYSFGVILVELLTRKKPFSYLSSDGDGLVMHFVNLQAEGYLSEILDPQIKEEGGKEVEEVATLAMLCVKMSGEDRPTMRQVESTLEGIQASLESVKSNIIKAEKFEKNDIILRETQSAEEPSRIYSMEQEFMMSASTWWHETQQPCLLKAHG